MSVELLYLKHIQNLSIQERLELIRLLINSTMPTVPEKLRKKETHQG